MKETFSEKLASLCSRELIAARSDPERIGDMVERLAHSLSWTIAIASGGDAERAQALLSGAEQYLYADAAGLAPVAGAVRSEKE